MSMVTITIQQTHFDGCPRDNQLWALEARIQVLLDEMMHLQEDEEIDRTIAYDIGGARAHVRAELLTEANYVMAIVLRIIEESYYGDFPPYNLLWGLETRMQVLIEQTMALQSEDEEESWIACEI
ncbi:hypothetical protein PENNAL_c0024G08372 [Penicillium nalgiovense]|uniref:Uncharacterized protein n=1 Tax=Penicillium nalgiovense TaxID=60175 RepID=A0A1V6YCN2_PENNA|nr:hypothetical protein PENNAL_c0024G08372 [Penicillium nalgiovense]